MAHLRPATGNSGIALKPWGRSPASSIRASFGYRRPGLVTKLIRNSSGAFASNIRPGRSHSHGTPAELIPGSSRYPSAQQGLSAACYRELVRHSRRIGNELSAIFTDSWGGRRKPQVLAAVAVILVGVTDIEYHFVFLSSFRESCSPMMMPDATNRPEQKGTPTCGSMNAADAHF